MGSSPMYEGLRTGMNSEPMTPIVESQVPKNTLACQDEGAAQDAVDLMHKGNFIMRHQSIRPCVGGASSGWLPHSKCFQTNRVTKYFPWIKNIANIYVGTTETQLGTKHKLINDLFIYILH